MKLTHATPLLLVLSGALLGPTLFAADPASAAPSAPVQDRGAEFMKKFRQAMQVGAGEEMNRLIRTYQQEAVDKIVEICEFIADSPTDKLEEEIAALTKAWKAVYKTEFPDIMYEYFSLMRTEVKNHRRTLTAQYRLRSKEFREAEAKKEVTKFAELGLQMKSLGEAFEEIDDHFFASQAFLHWGKAYDETLRGKDADLQQAHDGYKKCIASRDAIQLKDALYSGTKERWMHLERTGYGDPAEAGPGAEAAVEAAAASALVTTFETVDDITAFRRPLYTGDEIYAMWNSVVMREKGTSGDFLSFNESKFTSPKIIRTGASKVMVDVDHDGEGDVEVPLTGKITPVEVTLGSGEEARQWAFLTAVGAQRDTYNGIQFNMSPSDTYLSVYVAPAASLVTTLGGVQLRVLDDNMDGMYGSAVKEWGHTGTVEQYYQPDIDSVVVGNSKVALPWSEYLKVGEDWYKMEVDETGQEIRAGIVPDLPTGTLKLDLKGLTADFVVVKGNKGKWENCYFDLTASKSGVEVPAGRYELFVGSVGKGKKAQKAKALMLPTRDSEVWTVEEGKTTVVKLGAPFKFGFEYSDDGDTVTVQGDSIHVLGSAKESYQRLWNCVARPDVSVRPEGKKRGSKGEGMKGPGSQEDLSDNGFKYAWFPYDLTLPKKGGEAVEVQLFQKKNKLFGKIESDWR